MGFLRLLLSGVLGACASALGKYISNPEPVLRAMSGSINFQPSVIFVASALCLALVLGANALAVFFFVKGMRFHGTLVATVLSSATSFVSGSGLGYFLFGEPLSASYFFGLSLIVTGAFLVKSDIEESVSAHPKLA